MKGTCQTCGCTDDRACVTAAGTCAWIDAQRDLCSRCARVFLVDPIEPTTLAEAALVTRALRAALFETGRRLHSLESLIERALSELEGTSPEPENRIGRPDAGAESKNAKVKTDQVTRTLARRFLLFHFAFCILTFFRARDGPWATSTRGQKPQAPSPKPQAPSQRVETLSTHGSLSEKATAADRPGQRPRLANRQALAADPRRT